LQTIGQCLAGRTRRGVDDCKNLSEHVALTRRYCTTTPEPKIEIYRIDVALSCKRLPSAMNCIMERYQCDSPCFDPSDTPLYFSRPRILSVLFARYAGEQVISKKDALFGHQP
jgi:hypothetical protein